MDSWREVAFDHGLTKYPLVGGHARVSCAPCHRRRVAAGRPAALRFAGVPQTCESCHREHQGLSAPLIDWGAGGETDPFRRSVNLTLTAIAGIAGATMRIPASF